MVDHGCDAGSTMYRVPSYRTDEQSDDELIVQSQPYDILSHS